MLLRSASLFNLHRKILISNTSLSITKRVSISFYSVTSIHKEENEIHQIDAMSTKIKSENVKHSNNMHKTNSYYNKINNNSNNNKRNNIKREEYRNDNISIENIKSDIINYSSDPRRREDVIFALSRAHKRNLELDQLQYILAINACATSKYIKEDAIHAQWAYNQLKSNYDTKQTSVYENMIHIYTQIASVEGTLSLLDDYSKHYQHFTTTILKNVFNFIERKKTLDLNTLERFEPLYQAYRQSSAKKGEHLQAKTYVSFAAHYCKNLDTDRTIGILKEMTDDNTSPTVEACDPLLEVAMNTCDPAVLNVLIKWYKNEFKIRLHQGQLNRILLVAANFGDSKLALIVFEMIREGRYDVTSMNYMCLLKALLSKNDILSAVEVLQVMEQAGIQFQEQQEIKSEDRASSSSSSSSSLVFSYNQYDIIKSLMIATITGSSQLYVSESRRKLDSLYFTLVQQAQQKKTEKTGKATEIKDRIKIPRLVLDAIVEAAGRMGMTDRAFATFQEYRPLFNVVPDINSFNSLLSATSVSSITFSSVNAMLAIFQDIESTSETKKNDDNVIVCSPNDRSFSLLLESMAYYKDFRVFDEVFDYMHNSKIIPFPRSLRRVAVALALKNEWDRVDKVTKLIIDLNTPIYGPITTNPSASTSIYNRHCLPIFLEKRLNKIKENQSNVQVSLNNSNNA